MIDMEEYKNWKMVTPHNIEFNSRYGKVVVPEGFLFDGDSLVPNITPEASAIHDFLYLVKKLSDGTELTKSQIDLIYHDVLECNGSTFFSKIYFIGVKLFGWIGWKEYTFNELAYLETKRMLNSRYKPVTWLTKDIIEDVNRDRGLLSELVDRRIYNNVMSG